MSVTVTVNASGPNLTHSRLIGVQDAALDAVLFDFNPANSADVRDVKALSAALIQKMRDIRENKNSTDAQRRVASTAITELEGAQMRCVKSYYAKG